MYRGSYNNTAYGYQSPKQQRREYKACRESKAGNSRVKRWLSVPIFLLALVFTSASIFFVLQRHGATLQPLVENVMRSFTPGAGAGNAYAGTLPGEVAGLSLNLSLIYQNPELRNGCEATSLAMLLRYNQYSVDKSILAYSYIPREDFSVVGDVRYGPHPGTAYPGDPATSEGFYCYPGPVVAGANRFLAEQASPLQAYDISGSTEEVLAQYIQNGYPVMVWVTMEYGEELSYLSYTWQLPGGKTYTPYSNLHCVVLAGVDDESYEICDPINGVLYIDRQVLFNSYTALGKMAVVLQ